MASIKGPTEWSITKLSVKACSHYHLDEDDVKAKLGEASVYHLEENDVEAKPPSIILMKTTLR